MNNNKIDFDSIRKKNKFINELNFTDEEIIQNYLKIIEISNNFKECNESQDSFCINEINMHEEFYRDKNGHIKIQYTSCKKSILNKKSWNYLLNYLICDYDQKIISSSTTDETNIKFLKDKKQLYSFQKPLIDCICNQMKNRNYFGFYLYGNFNIGKTYIMALFANDLADSGLTISFIDIPKIVREIKKSNSWEERGQYHEQYFQKMKNSNILVVDELGMEKFSNYIHIDMLLPIFQYRLINKMPVYFISNFSLEKLKLNYKWTNRDSIQLDKFINTIENLVENNIIELIGPDLRKSSL